MSNETMSDQERKQMAGNLQKRILDSMNNSFMSPQTVAWLSNMNEDLRMTGLVNQSLDTVLDWIVISDKIFDEFQRYAFQYNQSEPNNSFIASVRRPAQVTSSKYEGFVFNSQSAMIVTVEPKSITLSFTLPRFVYESTELREQTTPFMVFHVEESAKGDIWKLDDVALNIAVLPAVAKKIFARFVRVSRGEIRQDEPLKLDLSKPDKAAAGEQSSQSGDYPVHQVSRLDIITESILQILESVDAEIISVEAEGIASVKAKTQEKTEFLLKRSAALRAFRTKSAEMAQQWAAVFLGD
jgi:hypothetical protein